MPRAHIFDAKDSDEKCVCVCVCGHTVVQTLAACNYLAPATKLPVYFGEMGT